MFISTTNTASFQTSILLYLSIQITKIAQWMYCLWERVQIDDKRAGLIWWEKRRGYFLEYWSMEPVKLHFTDSFVWSYVNRKWRVTKMFYSKCTSSMFQKNQNMITYALHRKFKMYEFKYCIKYKALYNNSVQ